MIIGISGKKQHGKDTVAKIIQCLMLQSNNPKYVEGLGGIAKLVSSTGYSTLSIDMTSGWKVKKFADKLKQVVALLIGCTIEQLEDNKFKETPLGEEWKIWYWTFKSDNARVGTNIYSSEEEARLNHLDDGSIHLVWEILTPRKLLQLVGTECGRNILHPNIWVNALMADYKGDNPRYHMADEYGEPINWIVTDVRFPNEAKAIESREGVIFRVHRPNITEDNHSSETSLDKYPFEYWIYNNGSIEDLILQVKTHLETLKLL